MLEEIEARIVRFKAMLTAEGVERTMSELVLRHDCAVVGAELELAIRTEVAVKLAVPVDDVIIVGSAKLGFSPKPGQPFKHFSDSSDVDVAIVSSSLFVDIWHEVLEMKNGGEHIKHLPRFQHYHFHGWIRPDLMPSSSVYRRCRDWWEFFQELSGREDFRRRPIRGGLYYDLSFLKTYQFTGLSQLHRHVATEA